MLAVLETLYTALGFRFATVCLKDVRAASTAPASSFGADKARAQAGFALPGIGGDQRDLFYLAMENDADLMIADAASPKIRDLLPAWHRQLLPDAQQLHRAAAGGRQGPARPVLRRPHRSPRRKACRPTRRR